MERPKVGVAAIVTIGNGDSFHILMGKRLKPFGYGKYAFPGGHLEFGENPMACGMRETLEETMLDIGNYIRYKDNGKITSLSFTNDIESNFHYVTLYVHFHLGDTIPEDEDGEWVLPDISNPEPDKCAGWEWINTFSKIYEIDIWEPILNLFKNEARYFGGYGDLYFD